MARFAYQDLSEDQFERLVVLICQRLLGASVKGFAKGRDGGRDAKFVGTAELHPSKAAPWAGTTIAQAKHTIALNASFSDADFAGDGAQTVLAKELPRVKALRAVGELDNYMLFSNRRLTGIADSTITAKLAAEIGIPKGSVYLCGIEQIELWLKRFPEIAGEADLDPVDSPLLVSPDDLAEVVEAMANHKGEFAQVALPASRVTYEEKNRLNKVSPEYARALWRNYLKDTPKVREFLGLPGNERMLSLYQSTADEFHLKIIAKRKDHQEFDAVMEHLADVLFSRDPVLRAHRRLTRVMLFYMYWNCDIGERDAATDQALPS